MTDVLRARVPTVALLVAAVAAVLDVATTMWALTAFDGDLMEGNPVAAPIGAVAGPWAMCLVGAAATMTVAGFTAPPVPLVARAAAWVLLAVKVGVVVSNFVHIGLAW